MMRYFTILLFLYVAVELKGQHTDSIESSANCNPFIPEKLKKFWVENFNEYVILVIEIDEKGDVERESISFLQHVTMQEDSVAVNLVMNTPPKLFKIDPQEQRSEDDCHLIAVRIGPQSIGLQYDILNLDNYLFEHFSSDEFESIEVGKEYFLNGEYNSALKYYKIALSNGNYQNAEIHYLIYQCLVKLERPFDACIYLEEAKNFDSSYKKEWKKNCK